jgi:hypothetical protein
VLNIKIQKLVIEVKYGGLGDHLFFSHIPRIAKLNGYKHVYISNRSKFRNNEIKKLVWESNPFIDGFSNDESTKYKLVNRKGNLLDRNMWAYGLDDGVFNHEPELYNVYLREIAHLKDAIIYDPNYISFIGSVDNKKLKKFLKELNPNMQLMTRGLSYSQDCLKNIKSSSLLDYCSIIKTSKLFICFSSGSATLASALGKPAIIFFGNGQNKIFHHSAIHTYVDVGSYSLAGYLDSFQKKIKNKIRIFLENKQ